MKTTAISTITPLARAAAAACAFVSAPSKRPLEAAGCAALRDENLVQVESSDQAATLPRDDGNFAVPVATVARQPAQTCGGSQLAGRPCAANDDGRSCRDVIGGSALGEEDNDDGANGPMVPANHARRKAALRHVIGRRLRAARALQGIDQTRAAEQLGYETSSQLSQWEQGKRTPPLEQLVAAAETYGTTTDFLLGLSNEPDRDAHMALRAATLRGVREMLAAASEGTVQLFERRAALIGPAATNVAEIADAGQALQDAIAALMRCNADAFDELRGGATVVRCASDFDRVIQVARRQLAAHRELGDDLQTQLRAAMGGC